MFDYSELDGPPDAERFGLGRFGLCFPPDYIRGHRLKWRQFQATEQQNKHDFYVDGVVAIKEIAYGYYKCTDDLGLPGSTVYFEVLGGADRGTVFIYTDGDKYAIDLAYTQYELSLSDQAAIREAIREFMEV